MYSFEEGETQAVSSPKKDVGDGPTSPESKKMKKKRDMNHRLVLMSEAIRSIPRENPLGNRGYCPTRGFLAKGSSRLEYC